MPNCSFHHIIMSEQALIQKEVLARLSGTGLTVGQPKILEYLSEHDGAGAEGNRRRMPHRAGYPDISFKQNGSLRPC